MKKLRKSLVLSIHFRMKYFTWDTVHLSFKALCFMASAGMVFYWIIKFQKNEDVNLVEYKSLKTLKDALQPEFTLCFLSPFLNDKFRDARLNLNSQGYVQYIKGETNANTSYEYIGYENVTINLLDYLVYLDVMWKSGKTKRFSNPRNCPFVTFKNNFKGFIGDFEFWKCFGIQVDTAHTKDITGISLHFDSNLEHLLSQLGEVWASFNYPQQLLQRLDGYRIWNDASTNKELQYFKIQSFEIVRRRFKPAQECFQEWIKFDDVVLERHIEKVGCRAPYLKPYKNFSICNTKTKLQTSIFNYELAEQEYPPPCQGISNLASKRAKISTKHAPKNFTSLDQLLLKLYVGYTDQMKVITQSRLIDSQALIGYIGGYVGLFLGKLGVYLIRL